MYYHYYVQPRPPAATSPVVKKGDRESIDLTDNIGYGAFRGSHTHSNEATYNETPVGSRRNGVYGGNPNELQSYAIYDVM